MLRANSLLYFFVSHNYPLNLLVTLFWWKPSRCILPNVVVYFSFQTQHWS